MGASWEALGPTCGACSRFVPTIRRKGTKNIHFSGSSGAQTWPAAPESAVLNSGPCPGVPARAMGAGAPAPAAGSPLKPSGAPRVRKNPRVPWGWGSACSCSCYCVTSFDASLGAQEAGRGSGHQESPLSLSVATSPWLLDRARAMDPVQYPERRPLLMERTWSCSEPLLGADISLVQTAAAPRAWQRGRSQSLPP